MSYYYNSVDLVLLHCIVLKVVVCVILLFALFWVFCFLLLFCFCLFVALLVVLLVVCGYCIYAIGLLWDICLWILGGWVSLDGCFYGLIVYDLFVVTGLVC